jgi:hypothetical protein
MAAKALLIGVNNVDADPQGHYRGWDGSLRFPEKDALSIAEITGKQGFQNTVLLTKDATRAAIKDTISLAADELTSGDIFLIYYSGHGNSFADPDGESWDKGTDETLCVYDRQLLDDELSVLWPRFDKEVRVLFLLDACHSGGMLDKGVAQKLDDEDRVDKVAPENLEDAKGGLVAKKMDAKSAEKIVEADPNVYKNIRKTIGARPEQSDVSATIYQIAGCLDNQLSYESRELKHGQFTNAMIDVWQAGTFNGSYMEFFEAIDNKMPDYQNPRLRTLGPNHSKFASESPFTI